MIREAIDRIVQLAKTPTIFPPENIEGSWSDTSFQRILPILPEHLHSENLESVGDFIQIGEEETYMIHIVSPNTVYVYAPQDEYGRRPKLLEVVQPTYENRFLERWMPIEEMVIQAQLLCELGEDRDRLLKIIGNLADENVKTLSDDGVTQRATVRQGVAKVEEVNIRNPFYLAMKRGFTQIEAPHSLFILRLKGLQAALFDVAGTDWRSTYIERIRSFLEIKLEEKKLLDIVNIIA